MDDVCRNPFTACSCLVNSSRVLLLLLQNALLSAVTPSKQTLELPNTLKAYAQLKPRCLRCDALHACIMFMLATVSHRQEVDPVVVNTLLQIC